MLTFYTHFFSYMQTQFKVILTRSKFKIFNSYFSASSKGVKYPLAFGKAESPPLLHHCIFRIIKFGSASRRTKKREYVSKKIRKTF